MRVADLNAESHILAIAEAPPCLCLLKDSLYIIAEQGQKSKFFFAEFFTFYARVRVK